MKFSFENGNLSFSHDCCEKKDEGFNQSEKTLSLESSDKEIKKTKIPPLIDIKESDINLKFIFDYIKNCGISAVVSGYGGLILRGKVSGISPWEMSNKIYAISFIVIGLVLLVLNIFQGMVAIGKVTKFSCTYYLLAAPVFLLSIAAHIAAYYIDIMK